MTAFQVPQFGVLENPAYVDRRVKSIASSFRLYSRQSRSIPFDPYACAESLGIRVREVKLPFGLSGKLQVDFPDPVIEIQRDDNRRRKRYTVCHELSHLCFLNNKPVYPRERGDIGGVRRVRSREERLCDMIAAELLMPGTIFVRQARLLEPSFDAVSRLASMFDVSIFSALRQILETEAWSAGLVMYRLSKELLLRKRSQWIVVDGRSRDSLQRATTLSNIRRILEKSERVLLAKIRTLEGVLRISDGKYGTIKFGTMKAHFIYMAQRNMLCTFAFQSLSNC